MESTLQSLQEQLNSMQLSMEKQTKLLQGLIGSDTGLVDHPSRGKSVTSLAIGGDKGGCFERMVIPTDKESKPSWEAVFDKLVHGKIFNIGTYMQKSEKNSIKDQLKVYIFMKDATDGEYQIKLGASTIFCKDFINSLQLMDDPQLLDFVYLRSYQGDKASSSHNDKVYFCNILNSTGESVFIKPEDKIDPSEWNNSFEKYIQDAVDRIRKLNNTLTDPLAYKRLQDWLRVGYPFDKVEALSAKLESDPKTIAEFGDRLLAAKFAVKRYLSN